MNFNDFIQLCQQLWVTLKTFSCKFGLLGGHFVETCGYLELICVTWWSVGDNLGLLGGHFGPTWGHLELICVTWRLLGVTWGSLSTSKINLTYKIGGLEGLKTENVEKLLVFKANLEV